MENWPIPGRRQSYARMDEQMIPSHGRASFRWENDPALEGRR